MDKKNHFFSRIHVEDIANILFKSLNNFKNNEIYNTMTTVMCTTHPGNVTYQVCVDLFRRRGDGLIF